MAVKINAIHQPPLTMTAMATRSRRVKVCVATGSFSRGIAAEAVELI